MNNEYRTMGGTLQKETAGVDFYRSFITKVYGWMAAGLGITTAAAAVTAAVVAANVTEENFESLHGLFIAALIVEIVLVMAISWGINRISPAVAGVLFLIYSIVSGVTIAPIVFVYTGTSIAVTFGITAGTFAAMSLYGYFTKADLTSFGNIMMMGLWGIVIATIINIFWANETLYWVISYLGVAIFTGLVAYDTNKLKGIAMSIEDGSVERATASKIAILGALNLYLDFVNLFLMLLRFFGKRR